MRSLQHKALSMHLSFPFVKHRLFFTIFINTSRRFGFFIGVPSIGVYGLHLLHLHSSAISGVFQGSGLGGFEGQNPPGFRLDL